MQQDVEERFNFFASWLDEKLSQGNIDTFNIIRDHSQFQRMREMGKIVCMLIFGFNQFIMVFLLYVWNDLYTVCVSQTLSH